MDSKELIEGIINYKLELYRNMLESGEITEKCILAAKSITAAYRKDGKVLFCGNGGSAADAQHLAAELSGRFYYDRKALYAEALHVNTSYLTAVANDIAYSEVFARMVEARGRRGDILVALSTSGNSENIIRAAETAGEKRMNVISLTGNKGGRLKKLSHLNLNIPSTDTPRIQEMHITLGHIICQIVEQTLFPDGK
ncbi:MAG: SIS domain-containing protein [Bacteroidales bacterium]|nr:SIS domain-containing protein [Bacteroidales bacterium]